jgi:hypothetical protein
VLVEQIDEPGEVGQRSGEAIDFVYDDDINPAVADIRQKFLQAGRSIDPPE